MQMPVSQAQGNEMHTTLQSPSIGGARIIAAGRSGHAVCSRERAPLKIRAQSGKSHLQFLFQLENLHFVLRFYNNVWAHYSCVSTR
uniref:Uncharacterized protein n=1 Tax=Physcomitrium patens TaxID=3218 RepID=A0A2K1JE03_PHYPA|nr:hypothetical protein PHYPA_020035 [Physcomitrium patens]